MSDKPQKRSVSARGKVRLNKLLDTAEELLASRKAAEITFKDVYERAGIPPGSAYHFYDNMVALYRDLAQRFSLELVDVMGQPFTSEELRSWRSIVETIVERAAAFYNKNAAPRGLLLQSALQVGKIYEADKRSGATVEQLFDRYFTLPEIPNRSLVFILATKFIHLVFSTSVASHGIITREFVEEAQTAASGYLHMYLPDKLPRR